MEEKLKLLDTEILTLCRIDYDWRDVLSEGVFFDVIGFWMSLLL